MPRAVRSLLTTLLALAILSVMAATSAHAARGSLTAPTPVAGAAWKVPVIRVYDATPRLYREGVDMGIREWNAANVGIRFARTTNLRAAHVVVRTKVLPGFTNGLGTLGMGRPAGVWLDTALVATRHTQRGSTITNLAGYAVPEEIATTMTHELGHVLGLAHTSGCSLMLYAGVRDTCTDQRPPEGMWSCRLIERRDLLAAARRYGGRGTLKAATYCPLSATKAGKVGAITAAASTRTAATTLAWAEVTNRYGYVLARSAPGGACPATPEAGALRATLDAAEYVDRWGADTAVVAARYCYAVWSRNGRGTLTGPTTRIVDVAPPTTAPVTDLTAQATGAVVQLAWTSPAGTTQVRIWRYATDGSCRVPSGQYHSAAAFGSATSAAESDVPAGAWTYAALRSTDPDDAGEGSEDFTSFPSAPACANVTVA